MSRAQEQASLAWLPLMPTEASLGVRLQVAAAGLASPLPPS